MYTKKCVLAFVLSMLVVSLHAMESESFSGDLQERLLSAGENITVGAAAGVTEVTVSQIASRFSNDLMRGKQWSEIDLRFKSLYKGYLVNAGGMGLITGVQVPA